MAQLATTGAALLGVGAKFAGANATASAQRQQGRYDQAAYQYQANTKLWEAEQADERAMQEEAAASRDAAERYRQFQIQQSRALAVGAAGGTRTDIGDVLGAVQDLESVALIESLNSLFEGSETASEYRKRAAVARLDARNLEYQGDVANATAKTRARSTIISGATDAISSAAGIFL